MRILNVILIAVLLSVGMVAAVQNSDQKDSQILGYAASIIAASDMPSAIAVINGTDLDVGIMINSGEYGTGTIIGRPLAASYAFKLCLIADRIMTQFPGRFSKGMGLVVASYRKEPLAGCGIFY